MSDATNTAESETGGANRPPEASPPEPVWTYRGYQLRSSDFTTSMVHLFRGEIARANTWRQRLDTTTNWGVVTTIGVISFAFSNPLGNHAAIILSTLLISLFLFIEARRYRYYELWSTRIRLMETDFFAAMLVPPFHPAADWAESLAETLLQPHFPISTWEAFGRRLRRNYLWLYALLSLAWIGKLWLHPTPTNSWTVMLQRAGIGPISGLVVFIIGIALYATLFFIGVLTMRLREATGEVLPRYLTDEEEFEASAERQLKQRLRAWFRPSARRRQLLALIITDSAQEVADRILKDMQRGVTALPGRGMFTGVEHSVLMCALTVTEVNQLKTLVNAVDPLAFVIVAPVQEILGKGFAPLEQTQK